MKSEVKGDTRRNEMNPSKRKTEMLVRSRNRSQSRKQTFIFMVSFFREVADLKPETGEENAERKSRWEDR